MRRRRDLPRGIKYKFCAGSYIVFLNINKYLNIKNELYRINRFFVKKKKRENIHIIDGY